MSSRTSSPPRVRPPSTNKPWRRRSFASPRWEAARAPSVLRIRRMYLGALEDRARRLEIEQE
ncbi:hypothetical protein, partial [Streptomyces mirabilis]